jgi:Holliday junction resolvasome RuvABC endonuclease subunit
LDLVLCYLCRIRNNVHSNNFRQMIKRVRQGKHLTVLTNDPSMTAWGWAVVKANKVVSVGCIKTVPENKVKRIRKSDDTIRRVHDMNNWLLRIIKEHEVDYILAEAPHGSQNASAATMIGMVTGMLQTIADCLEIPIEWYSEMDSKKCVLGKKSAVKKEMITAITKLYEVPWRNVKYVDEAVADAIAIYHTAVELSPTLKLLK